MNSVNSIHQRNIKPPREEKKSKKTDLVKESDEPITVPITEAPEFMRDNGYIKTGYLVNCNSVTKAVNGIFILHNESVNVWSHVIGAFFVIILIFYTGIYIGSCKTKIINSFNENYYSKYENLRKNITEMTQNYITGKLKEFDENTKDYLKTLFKNLTEKTSDFIGNTTKKIKGSYNDYKESLSKSLNKFKNNSLYTNSSAKFSQMIDEMSSKWFEFLDKMEIDGLLFDTFYSDFNAAKIQKKIRRWPIFIMLLSAILCLAFSAIFHMLSPMSKKVCTILSRFDYAGISLLIAGSCFPPNFYFFNCEPFLCYSYLTFISVFAISVFLFTLTPGFHTPERRTLRGSLFLALGISAGLPIIHLMLFKDSVKGFEAPPRLLFWYIGGASYIIGALMYIKRIPEKFYPGKFDIFGSSHQFFHLFVVAGIITHYIGSLDAFYYRVENQCPV